MLVFNLLYYLFLIIYSNILSVLFHLPPISVSNYRVFFHFNLFLIIFFSYLIIYLFALVFISNMISNLTLMYSLMFILSYFLFPAIFYTCWSLHDYFSSLSN